MGGLSTLIFIFNPAVIILGGGIMNEDYIISEIDKRIHSKDIRSFKTVQIKKSHAQKIAQECSERHILPRKISMTCRKTKKTFPNEGVSVSAMCSKR